MSTTISTCRHIQSRPHEELAKYRTAWEIFECPMTPSLYGTEADWIERVREKVEDDPKMSGVDVLGNVDADTTAENCRDEAWAQWLDEATVPDAELAKLERGTMLSVWGVERGGSAANDWKCIVGIYSKDVAMRFKLTFC